MLIHAAGFVTRHFGDALRWHVNAGFRRCIVWMGEDL
jgi:hypothetical protein